MRLGGRGLGGGGPVGGGEIYAERVTGGSVFLLSGQVQCSRQQRVAGGVLVACMLGEVLGPSSLVRKGTAILPQM